MADALVADLMAGYHAFKDQNGTTTAKTALGAADGSTGANP
jgi:hypothetical protein